MTQEEKDEIRNIIREELNARLGTAVFTSFVQPCLHEWYFDTSLTVSNLRCRKCGAMQNTYGGNAYPSFSAAGG